MKSRVWMSLGPNDVRQVSEYTAAEKVIIIIRSVLLRGGRQIVIATSNWNVPRGSTITHNDSRAEILLSLKPRKGRGLIKYAYTPWSWYIGKSEKRNSYIIGWRLFPLAANVSPVKKKVKGKKSILFTYTHKCNTHTNSSRGHRDDRLQPQFLSHSNWLSVFTLTSLFWAKYATTL